MTALETWLPAPNHELSTPILGKEGPGTTTRAGAANLIESET
jgi:hypothetical protein